MPGRRHEITRLESFSDAVFAFALTLLVVSLEVPHDMHELMNLVRGFLPFGATFAMVCWIWHQHHVFFRRYPVQDAWAVTLNCALLFVVLFYVYPLKYVTLAGLGRFAGMDEKSVTDVSDGRTLMFLYSSGVVAIFGLYALLYQHAWRKRAELELAPEDEVGLRYGQRGHFYSTLLGAASIAILVVFRTVWAPGIAGLIYFLLGPIHGLNGWATGRALNKLKHAQR